MNEFAEVDSREAVEGAIVARRLRWRDGRLADGQRMLPDERPIALSYDASAYAVMMATPADLHDFAIGFSLSEGVIETADEIQDLEVVPGELGVEVRMWLAGASAEALSTRRRRIAGPTGCGLCGVDSLAEATRPPPPVTASVSFSAQQVLEAMAGLAPRQALNRLTHAVHAAAFWRPGEGLIDIREDVGRHNALDKLAGALARANVPAHQGAVLLTSRVSVEMVQKAAVIGAPLLIAVSAPTSLAVKTAEVAGVTLVAVARGDGFEVFSRPERVRG